MNSNKNILSLAVLVALLCLVASQELPETPSSILTTPAIVSEVSSAVASAANQVSAVVTTESPVSLPPVVEAVSTQATELASAAADVAVKAAVEVTKLAVESRSDTASAQIVQAKCPSSFVKPDSKANKYAFKSCILLHLAAHIETDHGDYVNFANGTVDEAESICEDATRSPKITLNFECGSLSLSFAKDSNDTKTYVDGLSGSHQIEGVITPFSERPTQLFEAEKDHSFHCKASESIKMDKLTLIIREISYEIYRNTTSIEFYQEPDVCNSTLLFILIGVGVSGALGAIGAFLKLVVFKKEEEQNEAGQV